MCKRNKRKQVWNKVYIPNYNKENVQKERTMRIDRSFNMHKLVPHKLD